MSEEQPQVNLINYYCAECGGEDWTLKIGHCNDGRTFLYISCANQGCIKTKRAEYKAGPEDPLIWDEFDITGQGHDPDDMTGVLNKDGLN